MALEILAQCNVSGKHVVDPTMLLSPVEWSEFASSRQIKEKYILVYVMDGKYDKLLEHAEKIKAVTGLCIYVICFRPIKDKRIDKCLFKCRPDDFVALMRDAEFVITNSFHGTVFSTIFGKRLLVVGKSKYNSRICSFLSKTLQSHRYFDNKACLSSYDIRRVISFDDNKATNQVIQEWINESAEFLAKAIMGN
jgi:hypothetical protein